MFQTPLSENQWESGTGFEVWTLINGKSMMINGISRIVMKFLGLNTQTIPPLAGGFNLLLWKRLEWTSVGMMKFPTVSRKIKFMFQTTYQTNVTYMDLKMLDIGTQTYHWRTYVLPSGRQPKMPQLNCPLVGDVSLKCPSKKEAFLGHVWLPKGNWENMGKSSPSGKQT